MNPCVVCISVPGCPLGLTHDFHIPEKMKKEDRKGKRYAPCSWVMSLKKAFLELPQNIFHSYVIVVLFS